MIYLYLFTGHAWPLKYGSSIDLYQQRDRSCQYSGFVYLIQKQIMVISVNITVFLPLTHYVILIQD